MQDCKLDLVKIAKLQKSIIWLMLLSILSIGVLIGSVMTIRITPIGALLLFGCFVVFQLFAYFQTLRLSLVMDRGILMPTLLISGLVFPILSLIVLLLISNKATGMLKAAGVKRGIMGVRRSDYFKLMHGNCTGCGYSREGLDPMQVCPECGRQP